MSPFEKKEGVMNCLISYGKQIRNITISIVTVVLGLSLIVSSHAQTYRSEAGKKVDHSKQTTVTEVSREVSTDKNVIRPFRVNIPARLWLTFAAESLRPGGLTDIGFPTIVSIKSISSGMGGP